MYVILLTIEFTCDSGWIEGKFAARINKDHVYRIITQMNFSIVGTTRYQICNVECVF